MKGKWIYYGIAVLLALLSALHDIVLILIFVIYTLILASFCLSRKKVGRQIVLLYLVFLLSFSYVRWIDENNETLLKGNESYFYGKVISSLTIKDDFGSFTFKLNSGEKIRVSSALDSLETIGSGNQCVIKGKLTKPSGSKNTNGFNYKNYLYRQQIHWILTPNLPVKCIETKRFTIKNVGLQMRDNVLKNVENHMPQPTSGYIQALLFGDRSNIDENVLHAYQAFGIIHLLAISGLHIGLLTGMLFLFLIRIGLTRDLAYCILICSLPFYVLLAGSSPSVVRASIIAILVMLSLKYKGRIDPINSISIAFIIMVFYNPYYIFEIGFQLSFSVSLALLLSSTGIFERTHNRFYQIILVTLVAQLTSLPILLYNFYEFSPLSFILNIIFVPLFSLVVLPGAILVLILYPIPFLGMNASTIYGKCLLSINHTLTYIENFNIPLTLGKPPWLFMVLYYVIMILFFLSLEVGNRKKSVIYITLFILTGFTQVYYPYFSPAGEVVVLNVGQGDSILINLPYRKGIYLIDTGPKSWVNKNNDAGRDIVVPYLKSRGITRIDRLILTHSDLDHIGGTESIFKLVKVNAVFISYWDDREKLGELRNLVERGTPLIIIKDYRVWNEGGYTFNLLQPGKHLPSPNDQSLLLVTNLGNVRWLFTGDLEVEGEKALMKNYPKLKADILKIAHHGSNTSTTELFLEHTKPKVAIISAGKNNHYGHPHQEVVKRLQKFNVKTLRTDQLGAIHFKFKYRKTGTFTWITP